MPIKAFENKKPADIDKYIEMSQDISDYKNRLNAIVFLSKYKCYESKKELYRLMKTDKIFEVKEAAFRALQNFGESVKLTRKKKGKTIKTINDKLLVIHNSFNGDPYKLTDFKIKFKRKYPDIYDIYSYEKKGKFDIFIQNSIQTFPRTKIEHNYAIKIIFEHSINSISEESITVDEQRPVKDIIIIQRNQIVISCDRKAKINLNNIIHNEANSINKLITKSLVYYYIKANRFNAIKTISFHRIKTGGEEIMLSIPNASTSLEQVLTTQYRGITIDSNSILEIFKDNDKKDVVLQLTLTYLLKSQISIEPSVKFEKLWQSFNSIYKYLGNGLNENDSQIYIRQFIIDNNSLFPKSIDIAKHITSEELKENVRFSDLLQNDYDTKEKIVAFIAFIYRYKNDKISKNILDNIGYFENNLKTILSINQIESKFNKNTHIAHIYHSNKSSTDNDVIFRTVRDYLIYNTKTTTPDTEIEVIVFLCIKYCYYLRNKIFHAEKEDLTFRFAKNNIISEINWINNILETLIIELISANSSWLKHT